MAMQPFTDVRNEHPHLRFLLRDIGSFQSVLQTLIERRDRFVTSTMVGLWTKGGQDFKATSEHRRLY